MKRDDSAGNSTQSEEQNESSADDNDDQIVLQDKSSWIRECEFNMRVVYTENEDADVRDINVQERISMIVSKILMKLSIIEEI